MTEHPRFLLTDDQYAAKGAVVVEDGRYIGYDTAGNKLFDRKNQDGAQDAAEKRLGFRLVTTGYYGLNSHRPAGLSAPEHQRALDHAEAMKQAEASARAYWLPLGRQIESTYRDRTDVIGDVAQARAGNTVFRVGALRADGSWSQSAHVVLSPAERDYLLAQLTEHAAKHPA